MTDTDEGDVTNSEFVESVSPDEDGGEIVYDTGDLDADDYFVSGEGLSRSPTLDQTFEVRVQSLSAEFDDSEVTDEGSDSTTDLDIESNRGDYSLNVSADGDLDDEELFKIFAPDGDYDDATGSPVTIGADDKPTDDGEAQGDFNVDVYDEDEEDADEKIVFNNIDDREHEVNFSDIDTDEYEFSFEVTDTEAEDTDSVTVTELDTTGDFSQGVYSQTAGDVANVTLELEDTDDAYVQIGDEDSGFVDIVYVEDDDGDGEVSFQINTRTLGNDDVGFDQVYDSEEDIVESAIHGGFDEGDDIRVEDEDGDELGTDIDTYLEELDLIDGGEDGTDQLVRPLQATSYDLAANGNEVFVVNDDDESELDDEIDLATLELTEPGVDGLQTWTAPSDAADEDDNLEDVLDAVNESTEIAEDDRLVIQAEASGIYGHMVALDDNGFDALNDGFSAGTLDVLANGDDWEGEGVNFEVEADDATGNQDATSLDLSDAENDDIFVLVDNEEGQMYVIVDTSSSDAFDGNLDPDADFSAELEYEGDGDDRFEFADDSFLGGASGDTGEPAFPYFPAGDDVTQTESTDFSIVESDASFDNLNEDDQVEVAIGDSATVSGETNVAPGSDASVRVRSDDGVTPSFVETSDVDIESDGSFETDFDLSEQSEGDTGTVDFRVAGSSVADSDMVLVEEEEETANFEVSDLDPQDVTVTQGDAIDVSATVENTGEATATQTVEFQVDGDVVADQDVELEGGEDTTVEFTDIDTSGLDAGDYEHGVFTDDDSQTATLTVEEDTSTDDDDEADDEADDSEDDSEDDSTDDSEDDSTDDSEDDDETDDSTPGFGALVALVALIAAALLATRRRD
ncbi:BGTF surface domain-containing protein [Halorubrum sp. 48-1-W]|uniref:BGTF surface domain-containing protein n=1 Tax=Halorubrum sp. 48-1-W TaxID=2249761 RepID=UPI001F54392D|nr:BGTF surface domain-containing protein [Halorubrum sp. 48-1-W]